jgi:hypothetical protein
MNRIVWTLQAISRHYLPQYDTVCIMDDSQREWYEVIT